ncbi:hypothetical protein BDZ94DRAFT_1303896 [Collybia nuda]|uniref:Uncharacterized protein n=1 Tax=Collybia nuda TaxID=64659 RepID=A0A9P5YIU0_9AGAR|nr:hypothetical protein BDZ94DRAFT_1303896 [Collybia nuda]
MSRECAVTVEIHIKTPWPFMSALGNDHVIQDGSQFSSYIRYLSTLLATHSARIKKLCIRANEPAFTAIQRSLIKVPMPLLTHCCITPDGPSPLAPTLINRDAGDPTFIVHSKGDIGDAEGATLYPKLKSLYIHSCPVICAQLFPRNLQTLSLARLPGKARLSASDLRQVLLASEHSLQDLRLPSGAPLDSTALYIMSNVRSLSLAYDTPKELVPFLQSMKVPNLEYFSLKDLTRARRCIRSLYHGVYDASIELLVATLIDNLPLYNLTGLHLGWVRFLPYRRHLNKHAHEWIPNVHNLPIPAFLFRFMSLMTSLETLSMSDPDYPSLFSLNYYPRRTGMVGGTLITPTPVPMLSSLTLEVFNLRLVQKFIARRLVVVESPRRPLTQLRLKMPRNWRSKLRFNLSLVAERIVMADFEYRDRGEESILMEPYE